MKVALRSSVSRTQIPVAHHRVAEVDVASEWQQIVKLKRAAFVHVGVGDVIHIARVRLLEPSKIVQLSDALRMLCSVVSVLSELEYLAE